jgi:hypothetical protein
MTTLSDYMDICESLSSQLHQAKQRYKELDTATTTVIDQQRRFIAALEVRIETLKAELDEYKLAVNRA